MRVSGRHSRETHNASPELSTGGFGKAPRSRKSRNLVVSVVDGRVERFSFRRELLLGQIRVSAVIEKQLHDVHASDRGGI